MRRAPQIANARDHHPTPGDGVPEARGLLFRVELRRSRWPTATTLAAA
jgi:hypothetical protein